MSIDPSGASILHVIGTGVGIGIFIGAVGLLLWVFAGVANRRSVTGTSTAVHDGGHSGSPFLEHTRGRVRRDRSYGAYLRAIRDQPGLGWKIIMALCFNVAQWLRESVRATLILIAVELVLVAVAGYLYWRRWGR